MSHENLKFSRNYRANFGNWALETVAKFIRHALHKPFAPDYNTIAKPPFPTHHPIPTPFPDKGQALQSSAVASCCCAGGAPSIVTDAFCDSGTYGIVVDVIDDIAYIVDYEKPFHW